MIFRYTILYVENVDKTMTFYEQAFGLRRLFLHESKDYGELDTGETKLSFSSLNLMRSLIENPGAVNTYSPCFELALETDNVPYCLSKAVKAGAEIVQEIEDKPWGQTTAYVRDINGFLIEICSPINKT